MPTELIEPIIGLKTTELSSAGNLTGNEFVHVVQNGVSVKAQTAQWVALIPGALPPKTVVKAAGAPVPVVINNLQSTYLGYDPRPQVRRDNGDGTFTYYNDATVIVTEIAGLPDNVMVDVANDGTGHLADSIQIIFKP